MCIISSLYVSGFSSDTRCRDLKIKSQSVCHLLTRLPLPLPPLPISSRSPLLSQHLSDHLSGNDLCPFGYLQSPIDCRVYCVLYVRAELHDRAAWTPSQPPHHTCKHIHVLLVAVCGKLPQNAKSDLESFDRKWHCYRRADHQTKGNTRGDLSNEPQSTID